jgi:hypothetical protein
MLVNDCRSQEDLRTTVDKMRLSAMSAGVDNTNNTGDCSHVGIEMPHAEPVNTIGVVGRKIGNNGGHQAVFACAAMRTRLFQRSTICFNAFA